VLHHARRAQPGLAGNLLEVETVMGFGPDAVLINNADHRYGHREQAGGDGGDSVEGAIWRRVKDLIAANSVQPLLLVHD
jgi:hypothetical protein